MCRLLHRAPLKRGRERGDLRGLLVSEMLKRSVEEENCTMYAVEERLLGLGHCV